MAAIDLIFRAGLETERLHQLALSALFRHTTLADVIVPGFGRPTDIQWEPRGGTFDLGIVNAAGRTVMIELKIDHHLHNDQVHAHLQKLEDTDELAYLLLGHAGITARPRLGWTLQEHAPDRRVHVCDGGDLREALRRVEITADRSEAADARDLASAYRSQLADLARRIEGFFDCAPAEWGKGERWAYYYGFFDHCRRTLPSMRHAGVSLVPTPKGSFFACHWKWTTIEPDVEAYLQLQNSRLCFKISVDQGEPGPIRDRVLARVLALSERLELPVQRPAKLGHGQTMTVGVLDAEQTGLGIEGRWAHFAAIVERAEQVIELLAEPASAQP
jgi:hypothetical protein